MNVVHNLSKSRFEAETEAGLAELDYRRTGDTVVFTHTGVPEDAAGQGVGTALAEAGLAWAKAEGARIVPLCPFVAAYLRQHPEAR